MKFRRWLLGSTLVLACVCAAGWWFHASLRQRYDLYQLRTASDDKWEALCVELATRCQALQPRLYECLDSADTTTRDRAAELLAAWARCDNANALVISQLNQRFAAQSAIGQEAALRLAATLAGQLSADQQTACRALAAQGCEGIAPGVREMAACLALKCEPSLVPSLAKLLTAAEPSVRRAGLIAIAGNRDLVADEALLPLLNDANAEVRETCVLVLRGRGLSSREVELGALLVSPAVTDRLQLVQQLVGDREIDRGAWLNRLAGDSEPAVRAAVVRALAEASLLGSDHPITHLAEHDRDMTVRRNARHFLTNRAGIRAVAGP